MKCFEVYRNGEKLCVAGVGEFGVLSAIVTWVVHSPEKLARWAAEGREETPQEKLDLTVDGMGGPDDTIVPHEHLRWVDCDVTVGDEILVKVVEQPTADEPSMRKREDPDLHVKSRKEYIRQVVKELGWTLTEGQTETEETSCDKRK